LTKNELDRRQFLGAATGAGLLLIKPQLVRGTAANSAVRLGLLGCGQRGTEEAGSFARSTSARIVGLGDLFQDKLDAGRQHFNALNASLGYGGPEHFFRGPDAYEQMAHSPALDAVLIATPPYYHTDHLAAMVRAGRHVYCEKPVAIDVPNAKRAIDIGRQAEGRLSLDIGFQVRSATAFAELARRIHAGALGTIVSGEAYYFAGANLRPPLPPGVGPVEARLRNWIWDRTLSGDIIVEQNVHVIDLCNWLLQNHPVKAAGGAGRKALTGPGDISDHFNIVYTYPGDVHVSFSSTQFDNGWWDVCERFFGTAGVSESHYSGGVQIFGAQPWQWRPAAATGAPGQAAFSQSGAFQDALADADPEKEKAYIASITSGQFHNQAAVGAESALSAMLGREAAYSGRELTWDELLKSHHRLDAHIDLRQFA
jgi:myo-inositol 2-dehydrogenase/D-chiro-inositol 1-dehydrogenase